MPTRCERIYRKGPRGRCSRPGAPSLGARSGRAGLTHAVVVSAPSSCHPEFKFWSAPGFGCHDLPFEPNAVQLGTCQQVLDGPPVSKLLAENQENCKLASSRLRQALVNVGRVRPSSSGLRCAKESACNLEHNPLGVATCHGEVLEPGKVSQLPSRSDMLRPNVYSSNARCKFEAATINMKSEQSDSSAENYELRMEHKFNANQWIYETVPKHIEVATPWQQRIRREQEELLRVRAVLRQCRHNAESGFQAYVNTKHKNDAYDCVSLLPLHNSSPDIDEIASIASEESSDVEVTDVFKELFRRQVHSLPSVATRKTGFSGVSSRSIASIVSGMYTGSRARRSSVGEPLASPAGKISPISARTNTTENFETLTVRRSVESVPGLLDNDGADSDSSLGSSSPRSSGDELPEPRPEPRSTFLRRAPIEQM
mmetsp:Transcript_18697/g.29978  ORF Transcript_18697/g.29978 Transcript_18697/m.29978 type:complete len:427 (-) Transcript_18697:68-1348(-)